MAQKTFIFNGGTVGEFRTWLWPKRDGIYKYMPFRSVNHLRMHEQLRKTGSARCYYERGGRKVWFSVIGHPRYARLQLEKFESSDWRRERAGCAYRLDF